MSSPLDDREGEGVDRGEGDGGGRVESEGLPLRFSCGLARCGEGTIICGDRVERGSGELMLTAQGKCGNGEGDGG